MTIEGWAGKTLGIRFANVLRVVLASGCGGASWSAPVIEIQPREVIEGEPVAVRVIGLEPQLWPRLLQFLEAQLKVRAGVIGSI